MVQTTRGGTAAVGSRSIAVDEAAFSDYPSFHDYERLGLVGGAIHTYGELQGFIIASVPRAEVVVVHFQYPNAGLPCIYQVLLREACRNLFAGCPCLNLEDDLGLAGLGKSKLSCLPLRPERNSRFV